MIAKPKIQKPEQKSRFTFENRGLNQIKMNPNDKKER